MTEVRIAILDRWSDLSTSLWSKTSDFLSWQKRFEEGVLEESEIDTWGVFVCLIMAEKSEELLWSFANPCRRGTMTLVGDAVTQGVIILLRVDEGDDEFVVDGVENVVVEFWSSGPSLFSEEARLWVRIQEDSSCL